MIQTNSWFSDILDENIPARKEWDFHAGYQWTFFPESDKEKVAHWLHVEWVQWVSNADIGGGWYVNVPGSVVIDMSPVSLEKNPSREKILFDLDTIWPKNKLPLRNRSLETVTMTSVWQYLRKPEALLEDLKRVLVPGGKVYIVNQDGAWLSEYEKQHAYGELIMWQIHDFGYDVELIQIPIGTSSQLGHWYAVKVSMSQTQHELFRVEREYSVKINKLLETSTSLYQDDRHQEYTEASRVLAKTYAQTEYTRTQYLGILLHTYPITQASIELAQKAEKEAQDLSQKENTPVLLWSVMPKIAFDMYQEGDNSGIEMCALTTDKNTGWSLSWSGRSSVCGIHTAWHKIIRLLMDIENDTLVRNINKDMLRELLRFIQHHPLNDFTREKQEVIRNFLKTDFQKYHREEMLIIERELRVAEYECIFLPSKQTRKAEVFLARKREVEKGNIPTVGTGTLSPLTEKEKVIFLERVESKRC